MVGLMRALTPRFWLLFLLGLALGSGLNADYRDSYKAGVDAFESGQWQLAVEHLTAAIDQNPEARGGTLVRRYTPYYYLGLAQVELGRCRAAIPQLDEAERQGKVRARDLETLVSRRQECVDLIGRIDTVRQAAQVLVDEAEVAAAAVRRIEQTPVLRSEWAQGGNSFASRQTHWTAQIANARQFLSEGDEGLDAARIQEASRIAAEARDRLREIESEANTRRRDLQPVVDSRLREIRDAVAATQRDLAFVRNLLAPVPEALIPTLEAADAAIAGASAADSSTPIPELDHWLSEVRRELRRLRAAVQAPPDALMEAAEAYFRGDYGGSLEMLETINPSQNRVESQVCLFRAANLFALSRLGSLADSTAVTEQIDQCGRLDEAIAPPGDKFPPDFLTEWSRVIEEGTAVATDG